ncbi:MAG: DUF4080 domain-containing protein [Kiritimatiellae bacterium]|nr:DUF4080 domain-containing protein [Kiritimatiellia bacterium]
MVGIVLSTLNAKHIHAALGLRYLLANLGEKRPLARLLEFDIKRAPSDVVKSILAEDPRIVGLGVYVWNAAPMREVVAQLKQQRPEVKIILGGPEMNEVEDQEICRLADHVIAGEADLAFAQLCREILDGAAPPAHVVHAEPVDANALALPYDLYTDEDIAHRTLYVEASRGCPFHCEYCVSHDVPLRFFDRPRVFGELQRLLDRGATRFKFVDRTFNVNAGFAVGIMRFFLERMRPGLFVHFEMVPDRFPPELKETIAAFPPGTLQLEIGVQTFDDEVNRRIGRSQDGALVDENLRFLRERTGAHLHADLIAGLPGEPLTGFAAGFDRLAGLRPQKIQVGILKRLRGCPIARHDAEWRMAYNPEPPYEILENGLIDRATMDRIKRFARYWELIANRGNFEETLPLILDGAPFERFMQLSDWLWGHFGRAHAIPLAELTEAVFVYLTRERMLARSATAEMLSRDYRRPGRRDVPGALRQASAIHEPHAGHESRT